jgi:hypothetical protein
MIKLRTTISVNPKLYEDAQPRIAARYCTNFSEYVEDLIKDDVKAAGVRISPELAAAKDVSRQAKAALHGETPVARKRRGSGNLKREQSKGG